MAPVYLGAIQFLIGAGIATWGVGRLDRHDMLRQFGNCSGGSKIRAWAITLTGFAIAILSPVTVLFGRF
jgi:hypothetical protein